MIEPSFEPENKYFKLVDTTVHVAVNLCPFS